MLYLIRVYKNPQTWSRVAGHSRWWYIKMTIPQKFNQNILITPPVTNCYTTLHLCIYWDLLVYTNKCLYRLCFAYVADGAPKSRPVNFWRGAVFWCFEFYKRQICAIYLKNNPRLVCRLIWQSDLAGKLFLNHKWVRNHSKAKLVDLMSSSG